MNIAGTAGRAGFRAGTSLAKGPRNLQSMNKATQALKKTTEITRVPSKPDSYLLTKLQNPPTLVLHGVKPNTPVQQFVRNYPLRQVGRIPVAEIVSKGLVSGYLRNKDECNVVLAKSLSDFASLAKESQEENIDPTPEVEEESEEIPAEAEKVPFPVMEPIDIPDLSNMEPGQDIFGKMISLCFSAVVGLFSSIAALSKYAAYYLSLGLSAMKKLAQSVISLIITIYEVCRYVLKSMAFLWHHPVETTFVVILGLILLRTMVGSLRSNSKTYAKDMESESESKVSRRNNNIGNISY